jgi:general nucleoside transport system ATP-binding protein
MKVDSNYDRPRADASSLYSPLPFVQMKSIRKIFGNTRALDDVSLELGTGEVHALLGENGAGKTTLMNVLFGLYEPDGGEILVQGRETKINGPKEAISLGIFMVHQHFRLIGNFTALENIMLNAARGTLLDYGTAEKLAKEASSTYGLQVDLNAKIKQLPVGEQQRVELLKALSTHPKLLILDEPTSSLTPHEADSVLETIRKFAGQGLGVVFITHKIREVFAASDRITVLQQGKVVGRFRSKDVTEKELIELMMGTQEPPREILRQEVAAFEPSPRGPMLQVKDISVIGAQKERALRGVSFSISRGEILGVAGVSGNGQRELAEAVTGAIKIQSGKVIFDGRDVTNTSPNKMLESGLGYIPEDRVADGLLPTMSVAENVFLGHENESPFRHGLLIDYKQAVAETMRVISSYSVKAEGPQAHAMTLSGGNLQKVLVARALLKTPKLLVAHDPTRGLDIKATRFVMQQLLAQRAAGAAILLISEDLDELISISDRICAIYKGEIMGFVERKAFDKYEIGYMMAGRRGASAAV